MFELFHKPLESLVASDLVALKDLEEGWFLEYKASAPENSKIAKSICSFANTYGGYLIIGAKEKDKTRQLDYLPGILHCDADVLASKISEAIAHHVSPPPFFQTKRIDGPLLELGLGADKSLVVIRIPSSNSVPCVHSSGVIYRRVGDRSEPRPETDRATIDLLLAKSDDSVARFEHHLDLSLSSISSTSPQCIVVVAGDVPISDHDSTKRSFKDFCGLAADSYVNLDTVYPSQTGYVARMAKNNNVLDRSLYHWEYDWYWNAHIVNIPLSSFRWTGTKTESASNFDRQYIGDFEDFLLQMKVGRTSVIDISPLFFLLAASLHKIQAFDQLDVRKSPLKALIVFKNVAGTLPFLDTQQYIEQLRTHGIPLIMRDTELASPIRKKQLWLELSTDYIAQVRPLAIVDALGLLLRTLPALGIRSRAMWGESESFEEQTKHFSDVVSDLSQRYFKGNMIFGKVTQ